MFLVEGRLKLYYCFFKELLKVDFVLFKILYMFDFKKVIEKVF